MPADYIYRMEELGREFNDRVGKKCANLAEMAKMGLRVPPGFALSVEAYKRFMSETGAAEQINDYLSSIGHSFESINHFNEASADLRNIVESKEMPPDLNEEILSHYQEICRKCDAQKVAVSTRSAGASSHPGQYETHLNVIGELDLIKNIKKVWSSTFNARSLSARKRLGLPLGSDPIGVAVIKMVNARSAGVLFTADPNTGNRSIMMIEANWGLGESVVGGEAMPDVYVLDKETLEIIDTKLGSKKRCITCREVGVAEVETSPDQCNAFCLAEQEVKEIGKLGKMLEAHFGVPQDTEWAVDRDLQCPESVILLQTRAEVIAEQKKPVDRILDLMLSRFG
ncbi:MAG: PEP/pyruvate-binding domain-containing protein [Deltaproteobacteria bacterium]|nr:PEP/pyruvate-binding domain-containing protein [Deltaproteobacteria bacterium]